MANKKFLLAVLAIALIFAMTVIGCSKGLKNSGGTAGGSSGGGGTFTLTGIPAEYNGKYAYINTTKVSSIEYVYGFESEDKSTNVRTLPCISNGKVSIPTWLFSVVDLKRYSGSDTLDVSVDILNESEVTNSGISPVASADFKSVKFSKGSAAKAWKDKE